MAEQKGGMPYVERRGSLVWALIALVGLALVALMAACALGSARIPLDGVLSTAWAHLTGQPAMEESWSVILMKVRLPRALLAYVVGAALSVSGACMQGLFKNPMADPHILGVSSGAALGAALAMVLKWQSGFMGLGAVSLCAFAGGALSVLVVLSLSRVRGRMSTISLLLSGVAVSAFLSALLSGLMMLNRDKMEHIYLWTMGSFTAASWEKLAWAAPVTLVGALGLRLFARDLNALLMGEDEARTLGISVARVRLIVLGLCTLVTATAVSVSGVIGFVGLMVPHAVRMVVGPDHRAVIPVSLLAGGAYLLVMDTLARTIAMPTEIAVGVLTAAVGGPFFLYLLRRSRLG